MSAEANDRLGIDTDHLEDSLERCFISPNECDSNMEPANVVDVIGKAARSLNAVAKAITPQNAMAGSDVAGGHVESLTEAVMGITAGLFRIADAIERLADAVGERGQSG